MVVLFCLILFLIFLFLILFLLLFQSHNLPLLFENLLDFENPLLTCRIFIVSRLVLLPTLLFLQLEILRPPQVYHTLSLRISLIKSFLMLTIVLACLFRLFFSLNSFIKPSNIHIGERLCRLKSPLSRKITLGP